MAGFEAKTGIGARFLLVVLLSTVASPFVLMLFVAVIQGLLPGGALPQPGGLGFVALLGAVVATMLLPVTLPGAVVAWVAAWHLAWRRGWPERGRACIAGAAAGIGATAGLVVWGQVGASPPRAAPNSGLGLICAAAVLAGVAVAALVYHPVWRRLDARGEP